MSDKPVAGWVQAGDGKWYDPRSTPPANEATALLRQIAKDMATVRSIAVFWTVVSVIGIVLAVVALGNASNNTFG